MLVSDASYVFVRLSGKGEKEGGSAAADEARLRPVKSGGMSLVWQVLVTMAM